MCNIPITELMNVPSVRSQVEEFLDGIGQYKTPEFALESSHIQSPNGMQPSKDKKDPPVNIQSAIYERKNGGHPPFYLTLHIQNMLLHNCMLDSRACHECNAFACHERNGIRSDQALWKCLWHRLKASTILRFDQKP